MTQIPLSDLCHAVTKGTTPTTLGKSFVESGINFIKAESILNNHSIDQSNLKVEGQTIPLGIITDNTIYTIIRVQIGSQLLKDENKLALLEYLNQLNRSYKVFKYVAAEDGSIFLDACLPSTNDSFDAEIVRVILDVIVDHLNNEYKNIMKQAWK